MTPWCFQSDLHASVYALLSEEEEDDDEGADLNSSAQAMSETEDDDSQISKKDVSLPSRPLC